MTKHDLDAKLLRAFVTIVDLRSFTRAGRHLGISQSAISQQIAAQERMLGVKLLVRAGKGVRPTPAGEILLHYARQILQKIDEAQRVLTAYEATGSGVLRIGAGGAVSSMVRAGLGLAVVPRWAVGGDISAGRLAGLSIGKNGLYRAWGLGLRAEDHQPQQPLRAFVRLCLESLPALLMVDLPSRGAP